MGLLKFTDKGIYCEQADVYIDPWKAVDKAIITHGHSDHARAGHRQYFCHHHSSNVLKLRLGKKIKVESVDFDQEIVMNGVRITLHPAGHIIGSAQIRLEYKGQVWVISGDYKTENDGFSGAFQPIKCHYFITECTFGLPIYKWRPQEEVFNDINHWWQKNKELGKTSVMFGYSLGKTQRIIQQLDSSIGPVFTHRSIENTNKALRDQGIKLNPTFQVEAVSGHQKFYEGIVIAPPSAASSPWIQQFYPFTTAMASGWMGLRNARRGRAVHRGFVLSDHADWTGLNEAVKATGAEYVIATHGSTQIFAKWLNENGINTRVESTLFEGESIEISENETERLTKPGLT